jgi:hypothetical protein
VPARTDRARSALTKQRREWFAEVAVTVTATVTAMDAVAEAVIVVQAGTARGRWRSAASMAVERAEGVALALALARRVAARRVAAPALRVEEEAVALVPQGAVEAAVPAPAAARRHSGRPRTDSWDPPARKRARARAAREPESSRRVSAEAS